MHCPLLSHVSSAYYCSRFLKSSGWEYWAGQKDVTLWLSEDDLLIKKRHLSPYILCRRIYDIWHHRFDERKRLTSCEIAQWCVVLYCSSIIWIPLPQTPIGPLLFLSQLRRMMVAAPRRGIRWVQEMQVIDIISMHSHSCIGKEVYILDIIKIE